MARIGFDSRQTRRLLERMGVNLSPIPDVEEVIIRTATKDIVVKGAEVAEVTVKGTRMFQVSGSEVEEMPREKPAFSEEDVLLVAQQAGVSKERAAEALAESDGDLARAILRLTS